MPNVKFDCGHEEYVDAFGRELQNLKKNPGICPTCRKIEIANQPRKQELNLPKLEGSEKQVAWAKQIREKVIEQRETILEKMQQVATDSKEHLPAYIARKLDMFIESETKAATWIEIFKHVTSKYTDKPAYMNVIGGMVQMSEVFDLDGEDRSLLYNVGRYAR